MNLIIKIAALLLLSNTSLCQNPNFYFLTIGNSHYADNLNYSDLEEANFSADTIYNLFNKFGIGYNIHSSKNKLLNRKVYNESIDLFLSNALTNTNAIIIIYYCGHGQSDVENNLYLIPGDFNYEKENLNRMQAYKKLINVKDIQSKYFDNIDKKVEVHIILNKIIEFTGLRAIRDKGFVYWKNKNLSDHESKMHDLLFSKSIVELPKVFFLADCCYDKFDIAKIDYYNYPGTVVEEMRNNDSVTKYESERKLERQREMMMEFDNLYGKDATLISIGEAINNSFLFLGNTIVYSVRAGEIAPIVPMPKGKGKISRVGPIARRLLLYFDGKKSFTMQDLLLRLADPHLDNVTKPCVLEKEIRNCQSINNPTNATDLKILNATINIKKKIFYY
jgi:hypothetical protein